jgi:hypothetical protein
MVNYLGIVAAYKLHEMQAILYKKTSMQAKQATLRLNRCGSLRDGGYQSGPLWNDDKSTYTSRG